MAVNVSTFFDGNALCSGNKTLVGVEKDVIEQPNFGLTLKGRLELKIPLDSSCDSSDWSIPPAYNSGKFTFLGIKELYAGMYWGNYVSFSAGLFDPVKVRLLENAPAYLKDATHTSWFSSPIAYKGPGPNPGASVTLNLPSLTFGAVPNDNDPLPSRVYVSLNHNRKDSSLGFSFKKPSSQFTPILPMGRLEEGDPLYYGGFFILGGGIYPEYYSPKASFKGIVDGAFVYQTDFASEEKTKMGYLLVASDITSKKVKLSAGGEWSGEPEKNGLRGQFSFEPVLEGKPIWKVISFSPYVGGGALLVPSLAGEEEAEPAPASTTPPDESNPLNTEQGTARTAKPTGLSSRSRSASGSKEPSLVESTVGSVGLRINLKLNDSFSAYIKGEKTYRNDSATGENESGLGLGAGAKLSF